MNYQKFTASPWIQAKKMRLLFIKNGKHVKFPVNKHGLYTNRPLKEFMHEVKNMNKGIKMLPTVKENI